MLGTLASMILPKWYLWEIKLHRLFESKYLFNYLFKIQHGNTTKSQVMVLTDLCNNEKTMDECVLEIQKALIKVNKIQH